MTPTKLATVSAFAVALAAAPAIAQDMGTFDADADGLITEDEFGTSFGERGIYGAYDTDADGMLTEDEFSAGYGDRAMIGDYDADADGMLTEDEFNAGVFSGYDADASGDLSEEEMGAAEADFGEGGIFEERDPV